MPGSIPTSGTSLRQSLVRQRRQKSSHQYTDLDNGIVIGGAESDPLEGLAGEWADTEDLVADAAPSLALSPNEEMCLFLLKRAFQDLRSYNGWLTECLGPAIKGWERASHGERHRRVVRLKSALVRCLSGIAGVRAYLIEREGLFEMTCGLCDFDPQVFISAIALFIMAFIRLKKSGFASLAYNSGPTFSFELLSKILCNQIRALLYGFAGRIQRIRQNRC